MTAAVLAAALLASTAVALLLAPPAHRRRTDGAVGEPMAVGARTLLRWPAVRRGFRRVADPPIGHLLAGLAAELSAGQPPGAALRQAAMGLHPPPCPRACRAAAAGGDVVTALRADARAHGAAPLDGLAACWQVAEHSGAGLALAVSRLADGLRATTEGRAQLAAEIAAARASARLLAALPVFGLALGHWLGADPLTWLLGSWPGRLTLGAGLLLEVLGLVWLMRMVAGVRAEL